MDPDGGDRLENWLARAGAPAAGEAAGDGERLWREGREVGEWTVAGFVGRGGSAEVYCARHRRLGKPAVLKVLWRGESGPRERFGRETRFLMEAPGPAFPAFFGAGVEEGRPWIAMELLEEYPLPHKDADVAAYLLDVARGVAELHRRGWVHRDLKPRNILRRADGHAVLVDFGLLKRAGETAAGETAAGRVSPSVVDGAEVGVGTPGYAAPEQFAGGAPTPATDVHALGILAEECFGGKPPRAWERIIRKATASLPRQRYPDAEALARAIRRRNRGGKILRAALAFAAVAVLLRLASLLPAALRKVLPPPQPVRTVELPGGAEMEMVWCPPGTFTMGSPEDEEGHGATEVQHTVEIERGFWIARTEVTQRQWKSVMGDRPSANMGYVTFDDIWSSLDNREAADYPPYASSYDADELPVENVDWRRCREFCHRAGLQLPTETQWEYACRAGSTGPFAGSGEIDRMGWHAGNSHAETHPVAQKDPNAWGIHDMHGNVAEWCDDAWKPASSRASGGESRRFVRGGGYLNDAEFCRSARRATALERKRSHFIGFRPILVEGETPPETPVVSPGDSGGSPAPVLPSNRSGEGSAAAESAPKPFRNTVEGLFDDLVPIPGRPGLIGRHEVTQAQWKELMGGSGPSRFSGGDLPVDSVTPQDCMAFFKRLNALPATKEKGLCFRLPFAEEWQVAAGERGSAAELLERGWFVENSGGLPHPVGTRTAADGELFDLRGNVWDLTMTGWVDVAEEAIGFLCMGGSWADPVSETGVEEAVASPDTDWRPVPKGAKQGGEPGTLGFRVFADVDSRNSGR